MSYFYDLIYFDYRNIIFFIIEYIFYFYRKLTAACQTKAKRKKNKGITGIMSTIGLKKA